MDDGLTGDADKLDAPASPLDMPERLFHFTCEHGHQALGRRGRLCAPMAHPLLGCNVVWLTTEGLPDREATGLGMNTITCDRMRYRYIVTDISQCRAWLGSPERDAAPSRHVRDLESFGDPEHWWITDAPVLARLG